METNKNHPTLGVHIIHRASFFFMGSCQMSGIGWKAQSVKTLKSYSFIFAYYIIVIVMLYDAATPWESLKLCEQTRS